MKQARDGKGEEYEQIPANQAALLQMQGGICDEIGDTAAASTDELVIETASDATLP